MSMLPDFRRRIKEEGGGTANPHTFASQPLTSMCAAREAPMAQRGTAAETQPAARGYFFRLGFIVSFTASPTAFFRFSAKRLPSDSLIMVA